MGIAKLYSQSGSGGKINGIIEDYYAYAGENISAGDFVEFINGIASKKTETSVDTPISTNSYSGKTISAVVLDDNRVFIAHSHSTNYYLLGIVCTINGATIIPGVDTMLSASDSRGVTISAVKLEDNKVFVAHSAGKAIHLYGVICTIDNITITAGTDTTIVSNDNAGHAISVMPLTDNRVFIAHCNGTAYHLYGIICTITKTTITIGTDVSLDSVEYSGLCVSVTELENNKAFVAHNDGGAYYLSAIICTISGTTISKGTDTVLVPGYEHCGDYISTVKLENTKVFVAHSRSSSYYLNALICTINATTITPGTDYALDSTSFESEGVSTVVLPSGRVFISHRDNSRYLGGIVCTIKDTTITNSGDTRLSSDKFQGTTTSSVLINNTIFIAHNYDKDTRYLYAQIFGIDEANNVPTNNVALKEYETQVRKATTSDIYGVAKTNGTGGDSTGHKDIVSVYTVEQTLASLPVGTLVKDPNSTFLGEPVIWKIADVNHEGYPSNSVTLISDKILAMRCFDAMEPDNSYEDIQKYGYNNYSLSNIRQWLNSDAEAGQWYSAQQSTDTPPSSEYMLVSNNVAINPYDTKVGFLNGFSPNFKNALLETSLTVALNTVTDGGGSKTIADKMFLASNTEVGLANENNIVEGKLLSIFNDDASRLSYCTMGAIDDSNWADKPANENTAWLWWLRTPKTDTSNSPRCVIASGTLSWSDARHGAIGIRPLCNLPSSIKVTQDEDGIYKLDF